MRMKHGEKIAPLAALAAAVSSLACCLPLAFAAALGSAGLGVAFAVARPWLLGLSFVFLAVGFYQLSAAKRACRRLSRATLVLYGVAVIAVAAMTVFPQSVAGFLADFGGSQAPAFQPALADLDQQSLEALKTSFNRDSAAVRIILLLSPT